VGFLTGVRAWQNLLAPLHPICAQQFRLPPELLRDFADTALLAAALRQGQLV
jgi:hypothetical protein